MPIKKFDIRKEADSYYGTFGIHVEVAFTGPEEAERFLHVIEKAIASYEWK